MQVQKSYCAMGQRLLQRPSYGCLYKGSASYARRRNRSPSAAHRASLPSPASGGEGPWLRAAAAATSAVCYNDSALRCGVRGQRQRRSVVKQTLGDNKPTSCEGLIINDGCEREVLRLNRWPACTSALYNALGR